MVKTTWGQAGLFRNGAVGGIAIDSRGVISQPTVEDQSSFRQAIEARMQAIPNELQGKLGLRSVSLRQLEAAVHQAAAEHNRELPDEIRYLAGIQRVQYLLVYPEQHDIVLVGPAEAWKANEQGEIVGVTTGQAVLNIEDLMVAMKAHATMQSAISCSIDPTAEGTVAMQSYIRSQKRFSPEVVDEMARLLGPQQVTITGAPETSHFARVLIAADYRMKRIAMHLEPSPVEDLPSFLEMLASSRAKLTNLMPRWWLACDYAQLARSEDGLVWELRGPGVKVMTEDSFIQNDGTFRRSPGRENPIAAKWAANMNKAYQALSVREPVFGQVRNLMDLSVVAAVIAKEGLLAKAQCELPTIAGSQSNFTLTDMHAPKSIATECSFIKRGHDYLITASGGVQIDSWQVASRTEVATELAKIYDERPRPADRWWW